MLTQMIDNGSLKGRGLVGFWHAQSDGDDIRVYEGDVTAHKGTEPIGTFHGLRQQVRFTDELSVRHADVHAATFCSLLCVFLF